MHFGPQMHRPHLILSPWPRRFSLSQFRPRRLLGCVGMGWTRLERSFGLRSAHFQGRCGPAVHIAKHLAGVTMPCCINQFSMNCTSTADAFCGMTSTQRFRPLAPSCASSVVPFGSD